MDELHSGLYGFLLLFPSAVAPGSPFLCLFLVGTGQTRRLLATSAGGQGLALPWRVCAPQRAKCSGAPAPAASWGTKRWGWRTDGRPWGCEGVGAPQEAPGGGERAGIERVPRSRPLPSPGGGGAGEGTAAGPAPLPAPPAQNGSGGGRGRTPRSGQGCGPGRDRRSGGCSAQHRGQRRGCPGRPGAMAGVQQGEKQLFEKFWRGTFKAVATPRPESIIVASITARKPLPR